MENDVNVPQTRKHTPTAFNDVLKHIELQHTALLHGIHRTKQLVLQVSTFGVSDDVSKNYLTYNGRK